MWVAMWWDSQNLNATRIDKHGAKWHFRVWHEIIESRHVARVFFWMMRGTSLASFCFQEIRAQMSTTCTRSSRNSSQMPNREQNTKEKCDSR